MYKKTKQKTIKTPGGPLLYITKYWCIKKIWYIIDHTLFFTANLKNPQNIVTVSGFFIIFIFRSGWMRICRYTVFIINCLGELLHFAVHQELPGGVDACASRSGAQRDLHWRVTVQQGLLPRSSGENFRVGYRYRKGMLQRYSMQQCGGSGVVRI